MHIGHIYAPPTSLMSPLLHTFIVFLRMWPGDCTATRQPSSNLNLPHPVAAAIIFTHISTPRRNKPPLMTLAAAVMMVGALGAGPDAMGQQGLTDAAGDLAGDGPGAGGSRQRTLPHSEFWCGHSPAKLQEHICSRVC